MFPKNKQCSFETPRQYKRWLAWLERRDCYRVEFIGRGCGTQYTEHVLSPNVDDWPETIEVYSCYEDNPSRQYYRKFHGPVGTRLEDRTVFYEFDGKEVLSKTSPRWHFPYPWQIGWEPWHRYHGPIETRRHRPGESEPRAPCGWSYNDMLRAWEYDPAWKIKQRAGVLVPGVRLPRQERSDENVQR